jgi:hypothetical protein
MVSALKLDTSTVTPMKTKLITKKYQFGAGLSPIDVPESCTRKRIRKITDIIPTKARDAYIGPFVRTCREYAEMFHPSCWCILSAKYGFLFPDDVVPENYDASFLKKRTSPITMEELIVQVLKKRLDKFSKVTVLAGKGYVERAKEIFRGKEIVTPLAGYKGNGYMISALNHAIRTRTPL